MKILGCINDLNTILGNSYKVMTDKGNYSVCPENSSCVFVGLIEWEKADSCGYHVKYYKGIEVRFRKKTIFGKKVIRTADDTVNDIIKFMKTHPNKFEDLFNKNAKLSNKNGIYPKLSIKKILKESGPA